MREQDGVARDMVSVEDDLRRPGYSLAVYPRARRGRAKARPTDYGLSPRAEGVCRCSESDGATGLSPCVREDRWFVAGIPCLE